MGTFGTADGAPVSPGLFGLVAACSRSCSGPHPRPALHFDVLPREPAIRTDRRRLDGGDSSSTSRTTTNAIFAGRTREAGPLREFRCAAEHGGKETRLAPSRPGATGSLPAGSTATWPDKPASFGSARDGQGGPGCSRPFRPAKPRTGWSPFDNVGRFGYRLGRGDWAAPASRTRQAAVVYTIGAHGRGRACRPPTPGPAAATGSSWRLQASASPRARPC